jgi:hypothetical protein
MLVHKVGDILRNDIKWGRIAGLAAGAAAIALVTASGSVSFLPLVVFSIAGIFVERLAPQRPFWNSIFYALLGVFFYGVLQYLSVLGTAGVPLSLYDLLQVLLSVGIVVIPQSLLGTWIGVSIRKFGKVSAEARKAKAEDAAAGAKAGPPPAKGKKEAGAAQQKPARPRKAPPQKRRS